MYISCSAKTTILDIPEDGSAIISDYWSPHIGMKIGPALIRWKDGVIYSITSLKNERDIPPDTFEWRDFTLMPGFIDAHVHLSLDSIDFSKCLDNWSNPSLIEANIEGFLKSYLEMGITTIRDGGDINAFAWQAKKRVANNEWQGPEIVSVHEAVHRKDKYGRFLGRGFEDIDDWNRQKEDFFAQGLDQLKVVVTGIIRFDEYNAVGPTQWSVDELKTIVDYAHKQGKKVMAHASGVEGISTAIEAGVDSIEHGYYVTSEQLEKMKDKGIAWIPTVAPIGNLLKYPSGRYSIKEMDILNKILNEHLTKIKEAYKLNMLLGVGTDAGAYQVPHAESFFDELEWFNQAGIPMLEVYRLATEVNAKICDLPQYARVEVGSSMKDLQLAYL